MAVTLTARAAQHVQKFIGGQSGARGLRVAVKPTGCSGYMYVVQPAENITAQDRVFECHGVQVIVDEDSLPYLDGTEVDFKREGLNEGFKFENPQVKATCGCGESFSL